jgi:hypothetical protein
MAHYMVDCFFADSAHFDGFRKESFSVVASSDSEAIREASNGTIGNPQHFHVRVVTGEGDRIIYHSQDS